MARFDLYRAPGGSGLLLDVQSDLLEPLSTRVVVPLLPAGSAPQPARRLNPVFLIGGAGHVMMTQFVAAVPVLELGAAAGSLAAERDRVTAALDMLMQGF
jgi:toxin CcdB